MTATLSEGRRAYKRTAPKPTRISLNAFQRDVVLSALKREIVTIHADRNTPQSLKILAVEQLTSVIQMLDVKDDDETPAT